MDQLICASLSGTHYWCEVGMLKVPADVMQKAEECIFVCLFTLLLLLMYAPIWNATGDLGSCSYDAELCK